MDNMNNSTGAVGNTETVEKTYTQAEVDALLQSEGDRRVTQALEKQKKITEKQIQEAEKLGAMTAEQKAQYILDEKEKELQKKEEKLKLYENKLSCTSILSEKNIPVEFADLVLDIDKSVMKDKISILENTFNKAVQAEVEKRLTSTSPRINMQDIGGMTKEKFKKLSIAEQQKIYMEDKDLYNSLI